MFSSADSLDESLDTDFKQTAINLIKEIKEIKEDKELHRENDLKDNKHRSYVHKNKAG